LLAFFPGNDVRNNHFGLNRDTAAPYFVRDGGRLALDDSCCRQMNLDGWWQRVRDVRDGALRQSRVLQLAYDVYRRLRRGYEEERILIGPDPVQGREPGVDPDVFRNPPAAAWEEAWRVTEDLLLLARDETRARGADFWIVTLSAGIQVHPDIELRKHL
jgi:hypothetical protein